MKKVIASVLAALSIAAIALPEHKAEAQIVLWSNRCCDSWGNVRCIINPTPVGNGCFCYGQGTGFVC